MLRGCTLDFDHDSQVLQVIHKGHVVLEIDTTETSLPQLFADLQRGVHWKMRLDVTESVKQYDVAVEEPASGKPDLLCCLFW